MATPAFSKNTLDTLPANKVRDELVTCLKELKDDCGTLPRELAVVILGQWFHPLHYFPVFLSRLISVTPNVESQTHISRILWEELGEGDPVRAHEKIYVETMTGGGFEKADFTEAAPLAATRRLVDGYEKASSQFLSGLGFLYGTEVVDLQMVATIGALMKRCTGLRTLPWVDIHVAQEPGHVESSSSTLDQSLDHDAQHRVVTSAEEMWTLWTDFFRSIRTEILPRMTRTDTDRGLVNG
ncbi:MAG TPA: iron-containing redox enzyme family protein [Pyrinomonadaceae bacterium]|nr:iron-containing redox enzyme family protein [Pyrinomonadaceae bacterium]